MTTKSGKLIRLIILAVVNMIGVYSCTVHAQSAKPMKYMGFEVSFGVRTFQVSSNIKKIDGMQAGHEGGSLALVFGNDLLMARVQAAGVYYSNANTPHVQQMFETSATTNLYPLELLKNYSAKLRPYLKAGLGLDNVKFFGRYLDGSSAESAYDPYLGKLSQWNVQGGFGIEYSLHQSPDFIHIFAEATTLVPVQSSSTSAFQNTSISKATSINVGVSFGVNRRR